MHGALDSDCIAGEATQGDHAGWVSPFDRQGKEKSGSSIVATFLSVIFYRYNGKG